MNKCDNGKLKVKCYNSWDIPDIMAQEGIPYNNAKELRQKNFDLMDNLNDCNIPKIPHISHHIWFTSPLNPREIKDKDLDSVKKTIATLDSKNCDWVHYLWTNNKALIPNSIEKLEKLGIEVRNINEIEHKLDLPLKYALNENAFGMASDIFRYAVVESLGGIYFDMDYQLYYPLDAMTCTFNSFFGLDDFGERYFGNAFLAASPHHPVLGTAVDLVARNFLSEKECPNCPDYIKYPCSLFAKTITKTGPTVLTIAYYKSAHQNDNIDIGLNHGTVFRLDTSFPEGVLPEQKFAPLYFMHDNLLMVSSDNKLEFAQFGNDSYSGSWIKEEYFNIIDYYVDC